ncbi:glycosyltransferase family 4 protein [Paenibacillus sacheonensis]|uniref:Glycosyltransferase n=1 Tax=Paenibacillus sacheonensis TaxID=742054 RepID=A0A7X4YL57_9BACL|nr:glycosyltransferase family 4 protein [Paenibacillus sacheonensis]MBM7568801.1 spore coat protein SA [Paenibacillus sacheonensis]NBC68368.1 glycosyltransferase [Paenibacillus sacheonensis]
MKVLIIAPEQLPVPPVSGGSVENCIYQIAKHIPNDHQVTIVSLLRKNLPRKSVLNNTTILRVSGGTKQNYLANAIRKVKGNVYDVIQIDNRPSFAGAVRKAFPKTPISVFLHSMTFVSAPMTSLRKANADLKHANLIIGNSRSLQQSLARRFPAHADKVKFVHLGVDGSKFQPRSQPSSKTFRLLFAGRLIPRKGVPVLFSACRIARKSVPSLRVSVAGGTSKAAYLAFLKKKARSLGVPVQFKGRLTGKQMPAFYRSGHGFVCPSQKHEAFGLVNVEAMASGLPVIASQIGGIPEIVQHERNGLLVQDYRNPSAFAAQIVKLAQDSSLRGRLSKQAREDALSRFNWKSTAAKLMEYYQQARKHAGKGESDVALCRKQVEKNRRYSKKH